MPILSLGPEDALYVDHRRPRATGVTFVFFNALTGDAASWDAVLGPALRERGHGTLLWNFRGPKDSPFGAPQAIGAALIGGGRLIQDLLYLPLLTGPEWQAANRADFLQEERYEPLDPNSGTALLLAAGTGADWDLPYERLAVPVTVLSGLQDRVFFDAADVAELTARLPDALRIDLPDAGHLLTMERPQAILDACLALARRVA
jgi:hypothetical protein